MRYKDLRWALDQIAEYNDAERAGRRCRVLNYEMANRVRVRFGNLEGEREQTVEERAAYARQCAMRALRTRRENAAARRAEGRVLGTGRGKVVRPRGCGLVLGT